MQIMRRLEAEQQPNCSVFTVNTKAETLQRCLTKVEGRSRREQREIKDFWHEKQAASTGESEINELLISAVSQLLFYCVMSTRRQS